MVRLGLVVVVALCPSCIIASSNSGSCGDGVVDDFEQCDDGNTVNGDGCSSTCQFELATITTSWTFKNVATNTVTGCPSGFANAAVTSQEIDASGKPIGSSVIDTFDCTALTGVTEGLPFGTYQSTIAITDTTGTTYATSLTSVVDLTMGDRTAPMQTILNDGGYFHFTWTLQGATSKSTLTCAQANNPDSIVIQTTSTSSVVSEDDFPCSDGDGFSEGFVAGTYAVAIGADTNHTPLGTPTALPGEAVGLQNAVTDLGMVVISIDNL